MVKMIIEESSQSLAVQTEPTNMLFQLPLPALPLMSVVLLTAVLRTVTYLAVELVLLRTYCWCCVLFLLQGWVSRKESKTIKYNYKLFLDVCNNYKSFEVAVDDYDAHFVVDFIHVSNCICFFFT